MKLKKKHVLSGLSALFVGTAIFPVAQYSNLRSEINENTFTMSDTDFDDTSDTGIFVLTGDSGRIDKAIEIGKETGATVFISGCAEEYKPQLEKIYNNVGSPVILGCKAQNTIENAFEIKEWLEEYPHIKNLVIVTSDYHQERSLQALQREISEDYNMKFVSVSDDDADWGRYLRLEVGEFIKTAYMSIPFVGDSTQDDQRDVYQHRQGDFKATETQHAQLKR